MINILISTALFFINNYCYYASNFALEALKLNIYFNSIFGALADLIANLSVPFILKRFSRKGVFLYAYIVVILCSIGFIVCPIPYECLMNPDDYCW